MAKEGIIVKKVIQRSSGKVKSESVQKDKQLKMSGELYLKDVKKNFG